MAFAVHPHGTCCGACVIDGFYDRETYNNPSYQTKADMIRALRAMLTTGQAQYKGMVNVVLNAKQRASWHDTLLEFGFVELSSDVANPNHTDDSRSRLTLYSRINRYYQGDDREALGLPAEIPTVAPIPPVAPAIVLSVNVDWGVPIG